MLQRALFTGYKALVGVGTLGGAGAGIYSAFNMGIYVTDRKLNQAETQQEKVNAVASGLAFTGLCAPVCGFAGGVVGFTASITAPITVPIFTLGLLWKRRSQE